MLSINSIWCRKCRMWTTRASPFRILCSVERTEGKCFITKSGSQTDPLSAWSTKSVFFWNAGIQTLTEHRSKRKLLVGGFNKSGPDFRANPWSQNRRWCFVIWRACEMHAASRRQVTLFGRDGWGVNDLMYACSLEAFRGNCLGGMDEGFTCRCDGLQSTAVAMNILSKILFEKRWWESVRIARIPGSQGMMAVEMTASVVKEAAINGGR